MIKKEIEIDGNPIPFRASATVPRLYRAKFHRDIFGDLSRLRKSVSDNKEESSEIGLDNLEIFENVAYIMAKHADPSQPDTAEEWLDQFHTFSIYEVLPKLLELWHLNTLTDVENKKKRSKPVGE